MRAYTLPEARDSVRRRLGVPVAKDVGGAVGEPANMPFPSNGNINDVLNEELARLDTFKRLMPKRDYAIVLSPVSSGFRGPMEVPLDDDQWQPKPGEGGIIELFSAGWQTGTNPSSWQPLNVSTRAQSEYDRVSYLNDMPSTPSDVWIDRRVLFVYPAVNVSGTVKINAREGVGDWTDDTGALAYLPPNLQPALFDMVAVEIANQHAGDTEMARRLQILMPMGEVGRQRIMAWAANENPGNQRGMRPSRYRRQR
jgi:hypothetical protein